MQLEVADRHNDLVRRAVCYWREMGFPDPYSDEPAAKEWWEEFMASRMVEVGDE